MWIKAKKINTSYLDFDVLLFYITYIYLDYNLCYYSKACPELVIDPAIPASICCVIDHQPIWGIIE